jgi:hypothetical protein
MATEKLRSRYLEEERRHNADVEEMDLVFQQRKAVHISAREEMSYSGLTFVVD